MFGNSFYEMAVKSKATGDYYWKMAAGIIITMMGVLAFPLIGAISFLFFILGIWIIVAFAGDRKVEYEYTLTDSSVEVAAVLNARKRKELFSFDMDQVSMIVPKGSPRIANEKFSKIRNYTSKKKDAKIICMVLDVEKEKQVVMLEPNEKALTHIKTFARNKMYDI